MSYHYSNHRHNHDNVHHLAQRFSREARYSHHPTQYIVNDGRMIIDEKALHYSNAVIYNAPGSTMWLKPTSLSSVRTPYVPYHSPGMPPIRTCRGCFQQRELYFGNYCRDCTSARLAPPTERYYSDRKPLYMPERRSLGWR
ncbi:hypothetical protein F4779DRAFT_361736 [Xylariaceae sp. FL0662B]|nr:hypothetical protein F4779DRAFT_361736 [Xylariaceae sp. FL0662B]